VGRGISFGGVIASISADLIVMPLILGYRKFCRRGETARLVGPFYVLMVVAELATELIVQAFDDEPVIHPVGVRPAHIERNDTSFLKIVFLCVPGVVWWLARNKQRFGGGVGYAIDSVSGIQGPTADAPALVEYDGTTVYFCADRCRQRFVADPDRFTRSGPQSAAPDVVTVDADPMCAMTVDPDHAAAHRSRGGVDYWFCGPG
jgi:YHS domain-containing protein